MAMREASTYHSAMSSKRARKRRNIEAKMARLKALNIAIVSDGRELVPGTQEYERQLWSSAEWLSEEELASMETRNGVPLLPVRRSEVITLDTVNTLRDETP
jgi:hypothetical protein